MLICPTWRSRSTWAQTLWGARGRGCIAAAGPGCFSSLLCVHGVRWKGEWCGSGGRTTGTRIAGGVIRDDARCLAKRAGVEGIRVYRRTDGSTNRRIGRQHPSKAHGSKFWVCMAHSHTTPHGHDESLSKYPNGFQENAKIRVGCMVRAPV